VATAREKRLQEAQRTIRLRQAQRVLEERAAIRGGQPLERQSAGKNIKKFATDPKVQRTALEVGAGTAATLLAPEVAIPAGIARAAPLIRAGASALFAGVGEAIGSLGAETIDPSEKPLERAGKTGLRGAAGEVGGRLVGGAVGRIFRPGTLTEGGKAARTIVESRGGVVTPGSALDANFISIYKTGHNLSG